MFDQKAYRKEYARINKDRLDRKLKEWHEAHPGKKLEYSRKYFAENRELINRNARARRNENWEECRNYENSYRESTPYRFLSHKFTHLKKERHRNKKAPRYVNKITKDHLFALWDKQEGRCAITKKQMVYKRRSLYTVSIDRIDSTIGYIEGNVQLVCQAINLAKSTYSNDEIIAFWNEGRA